MADQTEEMEIDGIAGSYVEILGSEDQPPTEAIVGWLGIQTDRSWFVKMKGDPQLVRDQREAFRSFLQTLKFNAP